MAYDYSQFPIYQQNYPTNYLPLQGARLYPPPVFYSGPYHLVPSPVFYQLKPVIMLEPIPPHLLPWLPLEAPRMEEVQQLSSVEEEEILKESRAEADKSYEELGQLKDELVSKSIAQEEEYNALLEKYKEEAALEVKEELLQQIKIKITSAEVDRKTAFGKSKVLREKIEYHLKVQQEILYKREKCKRAFKQRVYTYSIRRNICRNQCLQKVNNIKDIERSGLKNLSDDFCKKEKVNEVDECTYLLDKERIIRKNKLLIAETYLKYVTKNIKNHKKFLFSV